MTPGEYVSTHPGRPVWDAQGRPCVVIGRSPESGYLVVAYGDGETLGAVYATFRVAEAGSVRWDGDRWAGTVGDNEGL